MNKSKPVDYKDEIAGRDFGGKEGGDGERSGCERRSLFYGLFVTKPLKYWDCYILPPMF